jgi:hypothetical protein
VRWARAVKRCTSTASLAVSILLLVAGCAGGGASGDDSVSPGVDAGNHDAGASHDAAAPRDTGTNEAQSFEDASSDDGGTGDDGSTADSGGGGNDLACGQLSTLQACQQCCLADHKPGYKTYAQTLESCACTNPGTCQSQCATEYCVQKPTSGNDPCAACLSGSLMQGSGACYTPVSTACQADLDCSTLFGACIPQCMGKP